MDAPSTYDEIQAAVQLRQLLPKNYAASGVLVSITKLSGEQLVQPLTILGEDKDEVVGGLITQHNKTLALRKETLDRQSKDIGDLL